MTVLVSALTYWLFYVGFGIFFYLVPIISVVYRYTHFYNLWLAAGNVCTYFINVIERIKNLSSKVKETFLDWSLQFHRNLMSLERSLPLALVNTDPRSQPLYCSFLLPH